MERCNNARFVAEGTYPCQREKGHSGKHKYAPVCANCGKKSGPKTWYAGKWYCPGACLVRRG